MGFRCERLPRYNVTKEGNAMARITRTLLIGICLVALCIVGVGCFGNPGPRARHTIKLYHGPARREELAVSTKTLSTIETAKYPIP